MDYDKAGNIIQCSEQINESLKPTSDSLPNAKMTIKQLILDGEQKAGGVVADSDLINIL